MPLTKSTPFEAGASVAVRSQAEPSSLYTNVAMLGGCEGVRNEGALRSFSKGACESLLVDDHGSFTLCRRFRLGGRRESNTSSKD